MMHATTAVHEARPLRILVAEDDHDLRGALEQLLILRGYDVRSVASGNRLLEEIGSSLIRGLPQHSWYDAIITDIRMPGRDGLSIVAGLRSGGWSRPIVVISAFGDRLTERRVERLGATFLPKPIDPDVLAGALTKLCRPWHGGC